MSSKSFTIWLTTFVEEKGLELGDFLEDKYGKPIQLGTVIQACIWAPTNEQLKIKDTIVKIDFKNGDVMHYFAFLAKALDGEEWEKRIMEEMGL